jgi:chorismate dehydratase
MSPVRLGAVEYLNARPLVYGLERSPNFAVRFDVPARCADLLHAGGIDLGLIPSIEYLRGPGASGGYRIVPDLAIASNGPVASVALFSRRQIADIRSISLDTSSRTSVALVRVLCARVFGITPTFESHGPDLAEMLTRADAALIIGDKALLEGQVGQLEAPAAPPPASDVGEIAKIDLGEAWTGATGLPFVYAFWTGRPEALKSADVEALQRARDRGVAQSDAIGRSYFGDPVLGVLGARYLRDNIKYELGIDERAGLERFYQYAAELDLVRRDTALRFY